MAYSLDWDSSLAPGAANACSEDTSAAPVASVKRHAACDECRKRKLKCSGEATGCSRCVKQSISCHYSIQKQMGRPPKKRTREDDERGLPGASGSDALRDANDAQLPPFDVGSNIAATSEAFQICPPVYFAPMNRTPETPSQLLSADEGHNHSWQTDQLTSIPATASPWPDFSSVSASASSLSLTPSDWPPMQTFPLSPPDSNPCDTTAHCTCLSYLYLCLSHLSSLAAFPISEHTLCSLFIASKTARDVIHCEICPKRFATGMQNIMLLGTLLNVIADSWLHVSQGNAEELGKEAAPQAYAASLMESPNSAENWKSWLRQTVRGAVIGGPTDQPGRVQCSDSPDLLSLIKELESRQRKWHSSETSHPLGRGHQLLNGQSTDAPGQLHNELGTPRAGEEGCNEQDLLCLRVVGSARKVISKFNFEPSEYPEGVVS